MFQLKDFRGHESISSVDLRNLQLTRTSKAKVRKSDGIVLANQNVFNLDVQMAVASIVNCLHGETQLRENAS